MQMQWFSIEPKMTLTNHSLCPWLLSWLSLFTAMTKPVPGLVGASVCSSIQPLNTQPNPPSPTILSGRKFLVAVLTSLIVKHFKLMHCSISPSVLEVRSTCAEEETLLLKPLKTSSSFPTTFEFKPVYLTIKTSINFLGLIIATIFYDRHKTLTHTDTDTSFFSSAGAPETIFNQ